jgi:DNA-binding MarR family transcriptional regulator
VQHLVPRPTCGAQRPPSKRHVPYDSCHRGRDNIRYENRKRSGNSARPAPRANPADYNDRATQAPCTGCLRSRSADRLAMPSIGSSEMGCPSMTAALPRDVARRLPRAIVRLRARLRAESALGDVRCTWSQLSTLGRIAEDGAATVSDLAVAEHVRPQSMAETVAALRKEGLVAATPDPTDRRKTLMSVTPAGRKVISNIQPVREAWLEAAIEQNLTPAESRTLLKAAEIMEHLADC